MEFRDYVASGGREHFDVLTIGDSFSNGGGGNYYQDYLADRYGLRVLNVPCEAFGDGNALSILYALQQTGYLAEISPRFVIVESVEHYLADRFNGTLPERPVLSRADFLQKELPEHRVSDGIREDRLFTPIMVILYSIITCSFYLFYWQYKMGESILEAKKQRGLSADQNIPIIYLVLCLFGLAIVSEALLQSSLNDIVDFDSQMTEPLTQPVAPAPTQPVAPAALPDSQPQPTQSPDGNQEDKKD